VALSPALVTGSIRLQPLELNLPPGSRYKAYKIAIVKYFPRHESRTLSFYVDLGALITLVSE
jgi:hypothetical protein